MNEKQFYTSPEVDVLVVRFEGNICASKKIGTPNFFERGSFDDHSGEDWWG